MGPRNSRKGGPGTNRAVEAGRRDRLRDAGEGEAQANDLFINAFGNDPDFFNMYRMLQTYRQVLAPAHPTLLLFSDSRFLSLLLSGPASAAPTL